MLTSKRQTSVTARGSPGPRRAYGRPSPPWPLFAQRVSDTPCACGGGCPRCATGRAVQDAASPVVTFDPQAKQGESQGAGSVDSTTGTTATTGQATAPRCQVQSFSMRFNAWNSEWPNGSGDHVLQLPVSFSLELAAGTGRADCVIGQDKKGLVEYGRFRRSGRINLPVIDRVASIDPVWTNDSPPGHTHWWDGTDWHAGRGSWGWRLFGNERATFQDEPGFASPSMLTFLLGRPADGIGTHSFPIYWGGAGHHDHYRFRTYVKDAATGATVRQLAWGMLIDYSSPTSGAHYFYTN